MVNTSDNPGVIISTEEASCRGNRLHAARTGALTAQPQGFNYSRSENVGFVSVSLVLALKNVSASSELFLTL